MARPKKQTIDYFPHFVNSGKTMYVLESEFGNDGYAFWFKLLELLGQTDGHFYDYKNPTAKRFLLAKTHVCEEIANRILDMLADLDAIDPELWKEDQVIWSQNLVDNVADAYKRRICEFPQKPLSCKHKQQSSGVSVNINSHAQDVSVDINPQSKPKERKVNKIKPKEIREEEIKPEDRLEYLCYINAIIGYYKEKFEQGIEFTGQEEFLIIDAMKKYELKYTDDAILHIFGDLSEYMDTLQDASEFELGELLECICSK